MKYGEAFNRLGYKLDVPRQDWTAEKTDGVCLTLWRSEIDWKSNPLVMDTRRHAGPPSEWAPAGNNKRIRHLRRAIDEFGGWVDVVIVTERPGLGVDKADPWDVKTRKGLRWRVDDLDEPVGHFVATALPYPQSRQ